MITLGSKVRDRVSGFKGVVIARAECLYASCQIRVARETCDDSGKLFESIWFEEAQVVVESEGNQQPFGFKSNPSAKSTPKAKRWPPKAWPYPDKR